MSVGQKWVWFEKGYVPYDRTSDDKTCISYVEGRDLLSHKNILKNPIFD